VGLDDDLAAYYDAEARSGSRVAARGFRVALREEFADVVRAEGRRRVIDVGAGPGVDTMGWVADGFETVGVDLGVENCGIAARSGLAAVAGSLYHLPFATASFDALWTMSTFVHVPLDRRDEALAEMVRVLKPNSPMGIGTWGGRDFEGVPEFGEFRPYRFFALAAHDRWQSMLSRHGTVEQFRTFEPTDPSGWEYQFAVLATLNA
jgi:ubiquinone/menaquinone biosynthesis C-methylase UbiE